MAVGRSRAARAIRLAHLHHARCCMLMIQNQEHCEGLTYIPVRLSRARTGGGGRNSCLPAAECLGSRNRGVRVWAAARSPPSGVLSVPCHCPETLQQTSTAPSNCRSALDPLISSRVVEQPPSRSLTSAAAVVSRFEASRNCDTNEASPPYPSLLALFPSTCDFSLANLRT